MSVAQTISADLDAVARWILGTEALPKGGWRHVKCVDPTLTEILRDIGATSVTARSPRKSPAPDARSGGFVADLSLAFPGRAAFTERLASVLEPAIAASFSTAARHEAADLNEAGAGLFGRFKPNVLVVGPADTGKSFLLSEALPRALSAFLRRCFSDAFLPGFMAYVDARFLSDWTPSPSEPFGPVQCGRLLAECCSEGDAVWRDGAPVLIAIDHLDQLWQTKRERLLDTQTLAAALAGAIRGVEFALTQRGFLTRQSDPRVSTHPALFIAAARLGELRSKIEKRVGESGTTDLRPQDIEDAGVPAVLAAQFPVILTLPPIHASDFKGILSQGLHPGFEAIREAAGAQNVAFDAEALDRLADICKGDFRRLAQLLAEIAAFAPRQPDLDGRLRIGPTDIDRALLRNTILAPILAQ
jgi:hypothetical protein